MNNKVIDIIKKYDLKNGSLITLLQLIQGEIKYVSENAAQLISQFHKVPLIEIYGVLTFYSQFYLSERGKNIIKICEGTACYLQGGKEIFDFLVKKLQIDKSGNSLDKKFYIEKVACLGCCGMAPAIVINEKLYGNATIEIIKKIVIDLEKQDAL